MVHDGKHIPPSGARRSAAAKKGLFVQPKMLSSGAVLISLAASFHLFGHQLGVGLLDLIQGGLTGSFTMRPPSHSALIDQFLLVGKPLLFIILIPFVVALIVTSAPSIIAKKSQSSTAASPLPDRLTSPAAGIVLKLFAVMNH